MTGTTAAGAKVAGRDDPEYEAFLGRIQARFLANLAAGGGHLFATDADPAALWAAYLDNLPADRQHYTCRACRRFVEGFGGLATADPDSGRLAPAIWREDDAPAFFVPAVAALARAVRGAAVAGVFLSSAEAWGRPVTGPWRHMAVTPPPSAVFRGATRTAGQAMAEKLEDYRTVRRALAEFARPAVERALTLLRSEQLYRAEKVIGPVEWLAGLHAATEGVRGPAADHLVWRAVAAAPAGFCHPRASMAGTLLEDIAAGLDFAEVSRRFAAKMHPLQYQRPQAAPSAGNIKQAEEVVARLGAAGSLRRRFARLDDVAEALWRPAPPKGAAPAVGVFGHLTPKGAAPAARAALPAVAMTWEKFARAVLPAAEAIALFVPHGPRNYAALLTAADPEAPPILQWDRPDRRNPVSWYVWHGGSSPDQWGLTSGEYRPVVAVTRRPSAWGLGPGEADHHGEAVILLLDGMRETRIAGAALFPECLKAEFHGVRSTVEAYSRAATIEGLGEGSACGLMLAKGGPWPHDALVRVRTADADAEYRLDRWD